MGKISWIQNGSSFNRVEGEINNVATIPFGIYEVAFNPFNGWSLIKTADKFTFNYKLYDLQNNFLDYICKTYKNTKGNLGVLLWGHRGSGKTISSKVLANILQLPVILVKDMGDNNDALLSYLSSFNFDCVLFFDEFEKQFNADDPFILQLMDGVYNSEYRKVFLLTTNELDINENLLSRPSRIRYVRQFGNLPKEVVIEYFEDNLIDKCCIPELLDYIDTLTISTIDIIKSIVEEINIHGTEAFLAHKDFFNVETATYQYRVRYKEYYNRKFEFTSQFVAKQLESFNNFERKYEIMDDYQARITATKNEEEREQLRKELHKFENSINDIYFDEVETEVVWNKLKPGMKFDGRPILYISIEQNLLITESGNYAYIYIIQNPNTKPSLYNGIKPLSLIL